MPTDGERGPPGGRDEASATYDASALAAGGGDDVRARQLAALAALLQRVTHQTELGLDVATDAPREVHLDFAISPDARVADLVASANAALTGSSRGTRAGSSNVGVAFHPALAPKGRELSFLFSDAPGTPRLTVTYDARLFHRATIDRMAAALAVVLERAAVDPSTKVDDLPVIGPDELRALEGARRTGTTSNERELVVPRFARLAREQPDAIAARHGDAAITYAELDARSSRVAQFLVARGVGPEVPVAVCVRPSLSIVVALLGIWKAGGVYLPLDPTHPGALVARMIEEAAPRVILTHAPLAALTDKTGVERLFLDADAATLDALPAEAPPFATRPDHAAYIFYTSGTTGRPKGVVGTHANLSFFIDSANRRYGFRATDVFSSIARYTFSISLFDLVSPLYCGGSVRLFERENLLAPERLVEAISCVTVTHVGPSLLGTLFRYLRSTPSAPKTFPSMHHASTGGDLVPPSIMEELPRVFANAETFVIYGSTEIACMGTTFPIAPGSRPARSFVGTPFPDVEVRILDARRRPVPFGVVGEIAFAGPGLSRGYLKQPALTAEKFVAIDGQRFYPMGDMGRLHDDGNVEILGRRDFQIQLRGIRVELGGIENMVRELGLAAQCAVVARTMGEDDLRLVAFVVKPAVASAAAFRRPLAAELPDYMLPQHVVVLDAMPLTTNGKLDRRALQELPLDRQLGAEEGAQPRTEPERAIARVFERVLGVSSVGLDDDFFERGGHSLLAVAAQAQIEHALGVKWRTQLLFEHATVRALAAHLGPTGSEDVRPILLNRVTSGAPFFLLSGVHLYRDLARRLDGRATVYGVFAPSEVTAWTQPSSEPSVEALAREYVSIVRRAQPKGPYRILGYSFAGLVAYEVAHQLRAQGEDVPLLVLLDAMLPEWLLGWRYRFAQLARIPSARPRDIVSWLARRVGGVREELSRFQDDPRVAGLERQREEINLRAAAAYQSRVRPYAGEVLSIVAGDRLRRDPLKSPSCGWDRYVRNLALESIGADHFRMLTDEPFVTQLAELLVRHLARTDRAALARTG